MNAFPDTIAPRRDDASLWSWALGLSLLLHAALVVGFGMRSLRLEREGSASRPPAAAVETVTVILPPSSRSTVSPTLPQPVPEAPPAPVAPPARDTPRFTRTSEEQASARPATPSFIGERNTTAASERNPVTGAPPLPSLSGIPPRDAGHLETTESKYQDGSLDSGGSPQPPRVTDPPSPSGEAARSTAAAASRPPASPPRETLLQSPFPVDVPVPLPRPAQPASRPEQKPRPEASASTRPEQGVPGDEGRALKERPFRGFQRKTAVTGSISRSGLGALDVEDSPLGRYQAAVSRAVELEWQRNCVRHRDFITPGFLTVRFFVDQGGRVRSVEFVGDMKTGEVQKGFTLNAIRDADLPAMPPSLRREHGSDPLELVFRFYF